MGCVIQLPKFISAKMTEKMRWLVHESETSFNPD